LVPVVSERVRRRRGHGDGHPSNRSAALDTARKGGIAPPTAALDAARRSSISGSRPWEKEDGEEGQIRWHIYTGRIKQAQRTTIEIIYILQDEKKREKQCTEPITCGRDRAATLKDRRTDHMGGAVCPRPGENEPNDRLWFPSFQVL
jgi:hypothetical protein